MDYSHPTELEVQVLACMLLQTHLFRASFPIRYAVSDAAVESILGLFHTLFSYYLELFRCAVPLLTPFPSQLQQLPALLD